MTGPRSSRTTLSTPPVTAGRRWGRRGTLFALGLWAGMCGAWPAEGTAQRQVDFNFQVRPLLSDRCFNCHGPDERARKAKLRLDQPESAYAVLHSESGVRALVPGHPERSEAYRRITTLDPDDLMPPPKSHLSLSEEEKELLRRWIAEGAEYQANWSFLPVEEVPVPQPPGGSSVRNPVDAFVLDRLQREGLSPSPEASRETLIRRLSFDLTGLPPSLEEIDAFLADGSTGAYERLVDRLLAAPSYGERRANEWLDLARYADTYGYQNDVERDLSPYRDWVIRAFNENLPYDQFVVWQLAGDLLPGASRDQVLATAFNRLHRQTNEGGSIDEEFRVEYVADRVHTSGTAFLGLTLECARCHDHKYDPIKQKDYYRMFAFFNNIDESGLYSHFTAATPSPTLLLYPEGAELKHRQLKERIRTSEAALEAVRDAARGRFAAWLESAPREIPAPVPTAAFAFEEINGNTTPNSMNTNLPALLVDGPDLVAGRTGLAMRFSGDNSLVCKSTGAFTRTTPFSFSLWVMPGEPQSRAVVFHRSRAWSDSGSRGYELVLEDGHPTFALIHFWPGNAIKVKAREALPNSRWSHLAVTYDGSSKAGGIRLYLNGAVTPVEIVRDNLFKDILHRQAWGDFDAGNIELTLAGRFRDSGFKNGVMDELKIFDCCLSAPEIELLAGRTPHAAEPEAIFAYWAARVDPRLQAARTELQTLREEENNLINDVPEIMVMHELPAPRQAYVLKRGAYDAHGEPVAAGVPEAILPFAEGFPRNRLGLARWMTDRRNPLTARVEVNRVWRTHFGRGLVATAEDFGSQGQLPTHPALLDWMARAFMDNGWDLKALHKLVVTSATYRQSSHASADLLAKDPDNRLLARGPKHRLQAEQIRDNALAISGLLGRQVGGPSVRPYQPPGLWEEAGTGKQYVQDKGDKLYRRSLYTFWKRTAPPPSMLTFDATSREICTAKRESTTTPLQALVLLNDPQFVEAGRVLAERLVRESCADVNERVVRAFRLATGRRPEPREEQRLRRLYETQLARFTSERAAAESLLKVGDRPADTTLPAAQVAATAVLAITVMNLDEFVMKR